MPTVYKVFKNIKYTTCYNNDFGMFSSTFYTAWALDQGMQNFKSKMQVRFVEFQQAIPLKSSKM